MLPMRTKKTKSASVGVIGKVLRILELLDQFPAGLELKDISARTGINKSTAHRFLSHLEAEGYLLRGTAGAFMLGPKIVRLGKDVSFESTLCEICRPTLEKLRDVTNETVNLAVLDGSEVLYIDVFESTHRFKLASQVGTRGAIYCTALGKAILAAMDEGPKKEEVLASIVFEANTPRTLTSIARLKKDLTQIRAHGFSHDDEEAIPGARCVGAAIYGADGAVVAAISVSGPTARVSRDRLPFYSAHVQQAAEKISRALGFRPAKPVSRPETVQKTSDI